MAPRYRAVVVSSFAATWRWSLLRVPCAFSLPPQSIVPNKRAYPPSPSLSLLNYSIIHFSCIHSLARIVFLPILLSTLRRNVRARDIATLTSITLISYDSGSVLCCVRIAFLSAYPPHVYSRYSSRRVRIARMCKHQGNIRRKRSVRYLLSARQLYEMYIF